MEKMNDNALYSVRYEITEHMLYRLERGTRILGFKGGARKLLAAAAVIAVICLGIRTFLSGTPAMIMAALGGALMLVAMIGSYSILKGWLGTKRDVKEKYLAYADDYRTVRECRFYEDYYEVSTEMEKTRLEYENIGRILDMSGMYVMLEKGDVLRFFFAKDVKNGEAADFAAFLERKSGTKIEAVTVK